MLPSAVDLVLGVYSSQLQQRGASLHGHVVAPSLRHNSGVQLTGAIMFKPALCSTSHHSCASAELPAGTPDDAVCFETVSSLLQLHHSADVLLVPATGKTDDNVTYAYTTTVNCNRPAGGWPAGGFDVTLTTTPGGVAGEMAASSALLLGPAGPLPP